MTDQSKIWVGLIVVVLVASGIIFASRRGDRISQTDKQEATTEVKKEEKIPEQKAVACPGSFVDTHSHDKKGRGVLSLKEWTKAAPAQVMEEQGVGCGSVAFTLSPDSLEADVSEIQTVLSQNPGKFIPFVHIDESEKGIDAVLPALKNVLTIKGHPFRGTGEWALFLPAWKGTPLTSEPFPSIFQLATENNLVVMLHFKKGQQSELETMLQRFPDTKVLFHGAELGSAIPDLLKKYPNLYYQVDTFRFFILPTTGRSLLFVPGQKAEFLRLYEQHRQTLLAQAKRDLVPIVAAAPNQVVWGTDAQRTWHFDPEVYSKFIEFSNSFIEFLPEEHKKPYTRENALKLLGIVE